MPPGFKRSRALWDETRDGGIRAWVRAICYELQPIRLSKSNRKQALATLQTLAQNLISLILGIPHVCKSLIIFVANRTLRQWMVVGAVLLYYFFIRWVHETLDAGPVVLILTALTLIFTIGLGDDENRAGLSAYSVFNKGFEQLLGSIDADSLLAQHVGGGMMMNMNMNMNNNNNNHAADHQLQQHQQERNNAVPPRRVGHEEENNHQAVENEDEANADDEPDNNNNNDNDNNRARKSGKKARRRDLDQRRELRRQREAATRIGLDGVGDGPDDEVAMQRIIEEQIAAENNR